MKKLLLLCLMTVSLTACHENLEDRAEREAREFTDKNCPTPPHENAILDSMVFYKSTHTLTYYYTLVNTADDKDKIRRIEGTIHQALLEEVQNNTNLRAYKDAGFSFAFIYRSCKNKKIVLYKDVIQRKDYQK